MFSKYLLHFSDNLFEKLSESVVFENITNGRKGANIFDYKYNIIPLVRTTTVYQLQNQIFAPLHYDIIDNIKKSTKNKNLQFNNALVEIYDSNYRRMSYHSDQSLDLKENSHICIFSCYSNPKTTNLRKLIVKNKIKPNEIFEIILDHNSIILFSTEINKNFLHKIILENKSSECLWLGMTFRQSKTFIYFNNELPYFCQLISNDNQNIEFEKTNKRLILASKNEKIEFYKYRKLENSIVEFSYPEINYTINSGDLILPEHIKK